MKGGKLKLFIIETSNFEFHIFAKDEDHLKEVFLKSWKSHLEGSGVDFDEGYFQDLINDAQSIDVVPGQVYCDREAID